MHAGQVCGLPGDNTGRRGNRKSLPIENFLFRFTRTELRLRFGRSLPREHSSKRSTLFLGFRLVFLAPVSRRDVDGGAAAAAALAHEFASFLSYPFSAFPEHLSART
jgi:hypothetical protein